jgi:hypothetical protein
MHYTKTSRNQNRHLFIKIQLPLSLRILGGPGSEKTWGLRESICKKWDFSDGWYMKQNVIAFSTQAARAALVVSHHLTAPVLRAQCAEDKFRERSEVRIRQRYHPDVTTVSDEKHTIILWDFE